MFKIICIGDFKNGSFGTYKTGCDGSDIVTYYAIEGDSDNNGFPRFASPHREAVESYRQEKLAIMEKLPKARWDYMNKIIHKIGLALVDAVEAGNKTKIEYLNKLAERAAKHAPNTAIGAEYHNF